MNIYMKQSLKGVPWNQLKSENVETLYLLSALKEPVQMDCKKACSVMEQTIISTFCWLIKNIFNPFHGTGLFLYFPKDRQPEVS